MRRGVGFYQLEINDNLRWRIVGEDFFCFSKKKVTMTIWEGEVVHMLWPKKKAGQRTFRLAGRSVTHNISFITTLPYLWAWAGPPPKLKSPAESAVKLGNWGSRSAALLVPRCRLWLFASFVARHKLWRERAHPDLRSRSSLASWGIR
jgi:hypothetical protein